jgi:hypothetical protein
MGPAVRNHARYRAGATAWMLGRFVVPVARLEEFEAAPARCCPRPTTRRAVAPERARRGRRAADAARLAAFDARQRPSARRARASSTRSRRAPRPTRAPRWRACAARRLRRRVREVPRPTPATLPRAFAAAARAAGVRLKLRTGGVTADAFPAPDAVLAFLAACAAHEVPAKCTAGLHHPLRGEHALTYEPECARGTMYGFVGVFLAAALLHAGHAPADVAPLLEERDAGALALGADDALAWRGRRVDAGTVADARVRRLVAFGSCSFEEPLHDLQALGWWPGPTPT